MMKVSKPLERVQIDQKLLLSLPTARLRKSFRFYKVAYETYRQKLLNRVILISRSKRRW